MSVRPATLLVACAATIATMLALPALAVGATYTLNFDSSSAGTVVSSGPGGVTLDGNPQVFSAGSNASSTPNALRRPGNCPNSGSSCTTGDHKLVMNFSNPARTVSLRAGIPATSPCNSEFGCKARLAGFNSSNNLVAITAWSPPDPGQLGSSMSTLFSIDAGSHQITKAIYSVDEDPQTGADYYPGAPEETAQIDDLTYNVLESGETPPPTTTVAAPTVDITSPTPGQEYATTDVSISGSFSAAAGVADACVAANSATPAAEFPSDCRQSPSLADGTFSSSRVPGMRPGSNEIQVWVRDTRGQVGSGSVNVEVLDGDVDFRAMTLEVTQAVQTEGLPTTDETISVPAGPAPGVPADTYDGVPLAQRKLTVVRMFAEARGSASGVVGTPALLHGYVRDRGGRLRELSGSPLLPHGRPDLVSADPSLDALRASAAGSFNFLLPTDWTSPPGGELILAGEVAPSSIAAPERECCRANNFFALQGIRFTSQRPLTVYPVSLIYTDAAGSRIAPPTPLRPFFDEMVKVLPAPVRITSPLRDLDVTDIVPVELARDEPDEFAALDRITTRLYEQYRDSGFNGKIAGQLGGGIGSGWGPGPASANGSFRAALDFVAHEVGHTLNLAHAHSGNGCDDADRDGVFDGPVSLRGPINGVGLDTEFWSGGSVGRFNPIGAEEAGVFDATPDAPANVYDYMSYCSNETIGATWVSTGYWATQVRGFARDGAIIPGFDPGCCGLGAADDPTVLAAQSTGRRQPTLRVSARIQAGSNEITNVETSSGVPGAPAVGSDIEVVVRDASGTELSRTPVEAVDAGARPAPGVAEPPPARIVFAEVPGSGAAAVEIVVGGVTVASRSASANAPQVDLKAPRRGARVGSNDRFKARWTATDADGDQLLSRVEFSADGGKTWKALEVARPGQSLKLRGSELPRVRNGRLRVTVSDGFNTDTDEVAGMRTEGARPAAEIVSPPSKTKVRGDTMVTLEGYAFDDAGRPVPSKRLEWTSGRRTLGRGESVDVAAAELARTAKLIATDSAGRAGSATIRLRVQKVAPVLTLLNPAPLSKKARAIRLRVASSLPGRLKISGKGIESKSVRVARRTETVEVRLDGRRRQNYVLNLRVVAGGRASSVKLPVKSAG